MFILSQIINRIGPDFKGGFMVQRKEMKFSFFILFLILIIVPYIFGADTAVTNYNTGAWDDKSVRISFTNLSFTESEFNPGYMIRSNPEGSGFESYTNQHFPDEKRFHKRMITLRGEFFLDENLINTSLSFFIGPTEYPFAFYLNQKLLFRHGSTGKNYQSSIFEATDYQVPEGILNYGNNVNVIWIELYPAFETAPFTFPVLADERSAAKWTFIRSLFNVHFIQCAEILGVFIGLFFLIRSFSRKFHDKEYLYFSLMCLFFSFSYFNIFFSNNAANELLNEKITRVCFPAAAMFITMFIREFTGLTHKKNWITLLLIASTAIVCFFTALQTAKEAIYQVFSKITSNIIITPFLIYSIILLVIAYIKNRKNEYLALFTSFAIIVAASLHDLHYFSEGTTPYCWLVPYGYFILIISIFAILAMDEYALFKESVDRTEEIRIKNESMKQVMEKIELVSQNLIKSSAGMEDNIHKAVTVIGDTSGSNKKILQGMVKELSNIENLTKQIALQIDIAGDRIPKAIQSQTSIVEKTNQAVEKLNLQIEKMMDSTIKTNSTAQELSDMAFESKEIVLKSKESMSRIAEYSNFLVEILGKIESIVEESNVLSINTAIESAHAGEIGKGFSIVAFEIREQAVRSKESLEESQIKLRQMSSFIEQGLLLSEKVTALLLSIIEKAGQSAKMVSGISEGMSWQKSESRAIYEGAKRLLKETLSIKELSENEQNENEKLKVSLNSLKISFEEISSNIRTQSESEELVNEAMDKIRNVLLENRKNSAILEETLLLANKRQERT